MARYERTYAGERRTVHLGVQITPSEAAALKTAAELAGATVSDYTRELLFQKSAAVVAGTRRNPEAAGIMRALDVAAYYYSCRFWRSSRRLAWRFQWQSLAMA